MSSSTPRCGPPSIVVKDAPKKSTIRGMSSAQTPADQGKLEHQAKEEFRSLFAHASKSQVKSLISMLGNLNQANIRYHVYLLTLKAGSRLEFKVNDVTRGNIERTYVVDEERVRLGMETFDKGLRNVYYYYKFRGTKKSKRSGDKEADTLEDLTNFRNYHRHLWVPVGSALYVWINSERFPDPVRALLQNAIPSLVEDGSNSTLLPFKGGAPILHILNSTIQDLFHVLFEANPVQKIQISKDKNIPKEQKQPRYNTSLAIQTLYNTRALHQVQWSDGEEKPKSSIDYNQDGSYTVGRALAQKLALRKQHGQRVYHDFNPGIIYMKDFMSITSLTTISGERMRWLYENYRNYYISQVQLTEGQVFDAAANGVLSYEEFRGDGTYRNNLVQLQQYINRYYKDLKERQDSNKPATVRKTMRVNMSDLLEGNSGAQFM